MLIGEVVKSGPILAVFGVQRLQAVMAQALLHFPLCQSETLAQWLTHICLESSLWRFAEVSRYTPGKEEVFNRRKTIILRVSILSSERFAFIKFVFPHEAQAYRRTKPI